MRRVGITFLAALAAVSVVSVSANPLPSTTQLTSSQPTGTKKCHVNPTPFVIPSLQEWDGGSGNWKLNANTRIVVDPSFANGGALDADSTFMRNPSNLKQYAASFQADISEVTGVNVEVVVSSTY
ncbi:hypothetical protein IWW41_003633, partial [Coemansia sp. RSA 2522]